MEAVYVQLKVSDPDDEDEMQALKDRLHPDYFRPDWEVITIPVKYDFGELWRWSVVLDRFAVSVGNTVGITDAYVARNSTGLRLKNKPLVWMNGVEPDREDSTGSDWDGTSIRTILVVWAVDPHLAAAALPELLPELGIPADAVGLVAHDDATPAILRYSVREVRPGEGLREIEIEPNAYNTGVNYIAVPVPDKPAIRRGGTGPSPDANGEPESQTVSAAASAESNGPVVNAKAAETDDKPDSTEPKQQAPAADSSGKDAGSSVTPKTSETDQDNRTTPNQRSVSAASSDEQAVSEVIAKTSSETDRSDTRELNRQTAGDVTSSRSTNPSWVLMGVAGVLVLAVLCAAIFAILRLRLRRA